MGLFRQADHTESVEYQSLSELYAEHGVHLPFEQWRRTVGSVRVDWLDLLRARAAVRLDERAARRALLERQRELVATKPLLPGVEDLLRRARHQGVAVGVASSADRDRIHPELARRRLLGLLGTVVTRDDVTAVKPSPEPYLRALAELGEASPERSVAFEDSAHGVAAATAAGMACIAVPSAVTCDQDFSRAHLVVERVDGVDLDALLRGRLALLAP